LRKKNSPSFEKIGKPHTECGMEVW